MLRRLTSEKVALTFFTNEKIFTVEPPINTQNNRVYAPSNKLKAHIADDRLFVTRSPPINTQNNRVYAPSNKLKAHIADDRLFVTRSPPINTQINRVYAPSNKLKAHIADDRLFVTRSHYSKSITVSVGVSKLGKTTIHFVNPGAKVNGEYYQNELLEMMLPEMRILAEGGNFIFQQDGARVHTAKDTVAYLKDNVQTALT